MATLLDALLFPDANMEDVDENSISKDGLHSLASHTLKDSINLLQQEFDAHVLTEVAVQVNRIRELEVSVVRLEEATRYRRQLARDREELESIVTVGVDRNRAYGAITHSGGCTQESEAERVKMNADTVTEAVEKALSSSQHGLMQALHQRFTVDEEQRLTLISTIQNLEQRLKDCKFSAWINEPEAQSTNKCVQPHRLEDFSVQGVDLEDELEQKNVEKRLCQAEINSLQRKLLLKEHENKQLNATIEELDKTLRNALLEKIVSGRHQGSLEIQLRACENELYETVNVLKKTQQVLEAERKHYSLRLRTNPLLSLNSFLDSDPTIAGVSLRRESEYSGQQDVLQGDGKCNDDVHEREETSTHLLDIQNVALECYDDIMPTRGPEVTADDGAASKCRKEQQSFSTHFLQPFVTDEGKKVIEHSHSDVEVSSSVRRREMVVAREFDSETFCTNSDDVGPHEDFAAQEKGSRGGRVVEMAPENPSRSQWNLDSLSMPCSFSDYKRALVGIGEKLRIEKEVRTILLNEETSTSKKEFVNGNGFMLQEACGSGRKQRVDGIEVGTKSYSSSQAVPELEFPIRHPADDIADGSSSSYKGTCTSAAAERIAEMCLLEHPANRTRASNGQVTPDRDSPFRGREQKACVFAQQGVYKDYKATQKDVMFSLMHELKHQESNCGQDAGSCKPEMKLLHRKRPSDDDKAHGSGQETNSVSKEVQCTLFLVEGAQGDYNSGNGFEHNQAKDEGFEFGNMLASETPSDYPGSNTMLASSLDTEQPVTNTRLHMQGLNEIRNLNDNGRRKWNLEDLEQDDLPISSSIDDEITSLRWRVAKAERTKQYVGSSTRHEVETFTDEEYGYESTGASRSSTEDQVQNCPSIGIRESSPPISSGDLHRETRSRSAKVLQIRLCPKSSSELLETNRKGPTRELVHVQNFYNFIPNPTQETAVLADSQGMSQIALPKRTRAQPAQAGLCGVINSQHKEQGDQGKSRIEAHKRPCERVIGGAMRELSELLSLHEASLRERFNHGKKNKGGSFENENIGDEKKENFLADSPVGVSSRRQSVSERRDRSRSREIGRTNFPIGRKSTHSEDARMDSSSRRSDAYMSSALMEFTDCDDPSDCFYKEFNSEESRTLRTHNSRTHFNAFAASMNPPDTGGTSQYSTSGKDKFSFNLDDALNHIEYLHAMPLGTAAKNCTGSNKSCSHPNKRKTRPDD